MRKLVSGVTTTLAASVLLSASDLSARERCPAIKDASRAGLYIIHGEQLTAVEGSMESAGRRDDRDMSHLFFEIALTADKIRSRCVEIGWRVEPFGFASVDAADFGGKLPSGTITLSRPDDRSWPEGEIEIWVPDDHTMESPERFRVVLINPITQRPLTGVIGRYDDQLGAPTSNLPVEPLEMRNRLIMTVEDAPGQCRARN